MLIIEPCINGIVLIQFTLNIKMECIALQKVHTTHPRQEFYVFFPPFFFVYKKRGRESYLREVSRNNSRITL